MRRLRPQPVRGGVEQAGTVDRRHGEAASVEYQFIG
jgi:hypothetical protein